MFDFDSISIDIKRMCQSKKKRGGAGWLCVVVGGCEGLRVAAARWGKLTVVVGRRKADCGCGSA